MGPRRLAAVLIVLVVLLVACGNRADHALVEDARAAELAVGAAQPQQPSAPGPDTPNASSDQSQPDSGGPRVTATGPAAAPGGPDAPISGPTAGPAERPTAGQPIETRFAPPGGNGGPTDVGVSETEIIIGNVADITGAVAGLFADVQKAAQAYELYFASTEGTIWGRQVRLVPMDTALTRNGNYAAYTKLCESAFMAAASMSAFDEGIEEPIRNCPGGFPDLRTVATNPSIMALPTMYSGDAIGVQRQPLSEYLYWAETYPDAVKKAGYVFVDNNTTREQSQMVRSGTEQIGWHWEVVAPFDLAAISYKTEIRSLEESGVRIVAFTGAYQQAAKLVREMVEEQYRPDALILQANLYDPRLIQEAAGSFGEFPIELSAIGPMVEEIEHHPQLQVYREWLKRIDPEAEPTGLGMYAWSATKLAYELLKQIGPEPTRAKMVEALAGVSGWTADGLVPAQDVGAREPTDCTIIVDVTADGFQRIFPAEPGTFSCRNRVVSTS